MRNLLLILLFTPTLLFTQSDSSKHKTIHVKRPAGDYLYPYKVGDDSIRVIISNSLFQDTIGLKALTAYPLGYILQCQDTATIYSFDLTATVNGVSGTILNNPGIFKKDAADMLQSTSHLTAIMITKIRYKNKTGTVKTMPPLRLAILNGY